MIDKLNVIYGPLFRVTFTKFNLWRDILKAECDGIIFWPEHVVESIPLS